MSLDGNGLSIADAMALSNNESGGFAGGAGGTWVWVFFLFFLLAWGGGGFGFGNNAAGNALTQAELFAGLGQQDVFRNQDFVLNEINSFERDAANRWGDIRLDIAQGFANTQLQSQVLSCNLDRNVDSIKYDNAKNTCDIISTNAANTQRIIDAMTANTVQELRDRLQTAEMALTQQAQTAEIINTLRPVATPAYITCSPYVSNSCGGCGYN